MESKKCLMGGLGALLYHGQVTDKNFPIKREKAPPKQRISNGITNCKMDRGKAI